MKHSLLRPHRVPRAWVLAWLGGPVLGVANGVLREAALTPRVGEAASHQLSTATLVVALVLYLWALDRRFPLPDAATAYRAGALWAALTVAFELGFGHYLSPQHTPWSELLRDYDVLHGRLWSLVPVTMALGPELVRRRRTRRDGPRGRQPAVPRAAGSPTA